jgi:hypothetical protein
VGSFWISVLAEFLASLPVFIFGLVVSHRKLARHINRVTSEQTGDIRAITDEQTTELEQGRGRRA